MTPGDGADPGNADASERLRARRWRRVAVAGFAVAVLSAGTLVAMQELAEGARERHAAEQTLRHHRMAALVSEIARETTIAVRMVPVGRIADLSAQLHDRAQGERGMMVRVIDLAGHTLGASTPWDPRSARLPSWSFPVDDDSGNVVAFVQGSVSPVPTPDVDAMSDTERGYGPSFWRPLLWFAAAAVLLSLAAWGYLWRAGPRVRDVVTIRAVDDLLRADYRVVWRAGRRGAVVGDVVRNESERPRFVSRAVRRVDASWQALRTYVGILDRTETDATQAVRRAADITAAIGEGLFPEPTPSIRRVVAATAQARWFSLLCGSGAGSVVGLLAYAGSTPEGWYGAFCVAAGWAVHRIWDGDSRAYVDDTTMSKRHDDASAGGGMNRIGEAEAHADVGTDSEVDANAYANANANADADAQRLSGGAASHGMRASSAALWISVFVASTLGVHVWPALSVWPGVLLPACLSIGVGVVLRGAIASARAVRSVTWYDATLVDVDTVGADDRVCGHDKAAGSKHSPGRDALVPSGVASCTVAVVVGVLFVGPGLSGAVASGWPVWCVVSGLVCVPLTAAIQAWRWQAVAGPWQRSSTAVGAPTLPVLRSRQVGASRRGSTQ